MKETKQDNSLLKKYPELAKEWYFEKNGNLTPGDVSPGSGKKVWWQCEKKHDWQALISNRTRGSKCPFCTNKKVWPDFNDLASVNQEIAKEWNYEKNIGVTPREIRPGTHEVYWWKCSKCGHEWKTSPHCRTNGNTGCPRCKKELHTSFQEQAIYFYLNKYFPDTVNSDTNMVGMELDMYIPSEKLAVEYDGYNWHKEKKDIDKTKTKLCHEKGIRLIRIREKGLEEDNDCEFCIVRKNNNSNLDLTESIKAVLLYINNELVVDVDVERDSEYIYAQYILREKELSLQKLYPELAKEWHKKLNGNLTPDKVKARSSKKVWWECSKGHEWKASIGDRVGGDRVKGTDCPYCSGRKVLADFNDLVTTSLEIALEWNYEKNFPLIPQQFNKGSNKKVWWRCSKGHEWRTTILCRSQGTRCPYCSGHKALKDFNDLTTTNKKLVAEWNYEKNGLLTPDRFVRGSHRKVWWRCALGHEWKASITDRAVQGTNCPICAGKKVLAGFNDLAKDDQELVSEWDSEKNILKATEVTRGSSKKVWWKCKKGHSWQAAVVERCLKKSGCPFCTNKKLLVDYNDLAFVNPDLASEWHPYKNDNLLPSQVISGSKKRVWWMCSKDHEWKASIMSRIRGTKCPICQGKKVLAGYNDLAKNNPDLASQWNPTKNGNLTPNQVTVGSSKKVWWMCSKGHEWQATVKDRSRGCGCPFCCGKRLKLNK